jgi:hypothetical protein
MLPPVRPLWPDTSFAAAIFIVPRSDAQTLSMRDAEPVAVPRCANRIEQKNVLRHVSRLCP